MKSVNILTVEALRDNYIFLLVNTKTNEAAAVDPSDAKPVIRALTEHNLRLTSILLTHHHADHIGGVAELNASISGLKIFGPANETRIPLITHPVNTNDEVIICGENAIVLDVHAHTRTHIAWYFTGSNDLFSGDTLFGGTCGAIFEGTPRDMFEALCKIALLPHSTRIWCSHEYTSMFLPEALRFEPSNYKIAQRIAKVSKIRAEGKHTVPLLLSEELDTNPFLRFNNPEFANALGCPTGWPTFEQLIKIS